MGDVVVKDPSGREERAEFKLLHKDSKPSRSLILGSSGSQKNDLQLLPKQEAERFTE